MARVDGGIIGHWVSAPDELSPESWHQSALTFTPDGRFAFESRSYGLYEDQTRDALSAITRTEGRYRIASNRLIFQPKRRVWWDHFEGAQATEHREEPYPWGSLFEDATWVVEQERLTMRFSVAPADVPVPVVAEYVRER